MRLITSASTFKTSYIAEIKESIGAPVKKRRAKRKIKTPPHLRPFIEQALNNLGPEASYRDIQEEALRLYNEHVSGEIERFFGRFKVTDTSFIKEIAEDKGLYYGDSPNVG